MNKRKTIKTPTTTTTATTTTTNVQRCAGLYIVLLQLRDHLELFVKRREFLPSFRFLSCRDMT